jgi:hypothetical protein
MCRSVIQFMRVGLVVGCLASLVVVAWAFEPQKPNVHRVFDNKKEDVINKTSMLPSAEVLERLKGVDFIGEDDYISKTIYKSFQNRRNEGITLSLQNLSLPERENVNVTDRYRTKDFYIGKKIFEVFPEDSIPKLLKLYETGDATTRGNVLRVCGSLVGPEITALLVNALNDKTFCDPEDPEIEGPPMRICDVAYNQLVLRYRIKNVLRTIGPIYRLENRDYHISVLKGRL